MAKGKVYLVGAGPGDPELISVKGQRILRIAETIIYDRLSSPALLREIKDTCQLIDRRHLSQKRINEILAQEAARGKRVVHLKGGDPFLFGRGAEEVLYLKKKGVDLEIIPGITSAVAVPEIAGIPLTHRDYASSVTIVTGQESPNKKGEKINWRGIAKTAGTLVILMGVKQLPYIVRELLKGGRKRKTPAAIIYRGTTPSEKKIITTLENLVDKVKKANIDPPCVVIVGEVVKLGEKLGKVQKEALSGKRIIVTTHQERLKTLLQLEGAEVIHFPTINLKPEKDNSLMEKTLNNIDSYDWIIFTSRMAVYFFWKQLDAYDKDSRSLKTVRIGVIGEKTEAGLKEKGIKADLIPHIFSARGLINKLDSFDLKGSKFLLPRSNLADPLLGDELRKRGALVEEIALYRNELPPIAPGKIKWIREQISKREIDLVTFTSGSTLLNFIEILGQEQLRKTEIACIGEATAQKVKNLGLKPAIIARVHTFEGLVETIKEHYVRSDQCNFPGFD